MSYVYGANGRMESVTDGRGITTLAYEAGNDRVSSVTDPVTGGGRTNTWDSQNRLVQCVYNGNTSLFTYAADGIRHRSAVNGITTDYVLDGPIFVRERRNGGNLATYLLVSNAGSIQSTGVTSRRGRCRSVRTICITDGCLVAEIKV